MKSFQDILVPLDLSEDCDRVLHVASQMCQHYQATATLLHVWEPSPRSEALGKQTVCESIPLLGCPDRFMAALEDARLSMLTLGTRQVFVALSQGTPAREVVRFAREGTYDLIVLGSRARTRLAHTVSRSVVEQVMRRALCTVMTVHLN